MKRKTLIWVFASVLVLIISSLSAQADPIPPPDTTPPSVIVSFSPSNPTMYDEITITVQATDQSSISKIQYSTNGEGIDMVCFGQSSCSVTRRYVGGAHEYKAYATDVHGNTRKVDGLIFVNIVPPTNTLKVLFVPMNYPNLGDFNSKVDLGINSFISGTPFSLPGMGAALEIEKLQTNCPCNYKAGRPHCQEEAFICADAAGIHDYNILVSMVNLESVLSAAWLDDNYIEVYTQNNVVDYEKYMVPHELLHMFNFCDTYDVGVYYAEEERHKKRKFLDGNIAPGCYNEDYAFTYGVGPKQSCTTLCSSGNSAACSAGVCGMYVNDGSSNPYNVDFMGSPFRGWQFAANPTKLFIGDYASMEWSLFQFGFSPNGAAPHNRGSSATGSVMEILYEVSASEAVLKNAKEVSSTVQLIPTPSGTSDYRLKIYGGTHDSVLYDEYFGLTFMTTDHDSVSLTETTVYSRVPWFSNANRIIIFKNENPIGNWDMKDSDGDSIVNELDDDSDNDGYTDAVEEYLGTDPNKACADTPAYQDEPTPDAWPPDFNDDQMVTIGDILSIRLFFNQPVNGPGAQRFDINMNGMVTMTDVLALFKPSFNSGCA